MNVHQDANTGFIQLGDVRKGVSSDTAASDLCYYISGCLGWVRDPNTGNDWLSSTNYTLKSSTLAAGSAQDRNTGYRCDSRVADGKCDHLSVS